MGLLNTIHELVKAGRCFSTYSATTRSSKQKRIDAYSAYLIMEGLRRGYLCIEPDIVDHAQVSMESEVDGGEVRV